MLFVSDNFELSKDKIVVLTKFYPQTKLTNTGNATANILKSKDGIHWLALTSLASNQSLDITLEEAFIYLTFKEDTTVYFQHQTPNHYHLVNEQKQVERLETRFDNLNVGGRNLVLDSGMVVQNSDYPIKSYTLAQNHGLAHGDDVVITIWGQLADSKTAFYAYNSGGRVQIGKLDKITDGVYQLKTTWKITSGTNTVNNTILNIYPMNRHQRGESRIDKIKLERGNIATDWTQAPEDLQSLVDALITRITALENR